MTDDAEKAEGYEGWAIVELFGHQRYAGRVTPERQFGATMLRLDVPEAAGRPASTHLYGGAAIYALHPCTEEIARVFAADWRPEPVHCWELPKAGRTTSPALAGPSGYDDDPDDDGEDEDDDMPL